MVWWIILCGLLVALDQWTKHLAAFYLSSGKVLPVINHVIDFVYVENRGAAFGFFQNTRWFLVALTVIILIAIIVYILKNKKLDGLLMLSLTFIFAGGLGNLIDRIIKGYVVDFIRLLFVEFPCFNVADTCVTLGGILLAIYVLFFYKDAKREAK